MEKIKLRVGNYSKWMAAWITVTTTRYLWKSILYKLKNRTGNYLQNITKISIYNITSKWVERKITKRK